MSSTPARRHDASAAPAAHLELDPTACAGYGVCAELLPELVSLDEWGYPLLHGRDVDHVTVAHAKRAVARCPKLALRLTRA